MQDHIARAMVYYLAVLCVSKYRSILEAVGKDQSREVVSEPSSPEKTVGGDLEGGSQNHQVSVEGGQIGVHFGDNNRESQKEQVPAGNDEEEEEQIDAKNIQRPKSVETDCSTTPDLDQAFHFPSLEGAAVVGGESSMPASVTFYRQSMDTSEQIEVALKLVGPFLCHLLVTYKSILSKVLVGSDGRPLLTDGTMV